MDVLRMYFTKKMQKETSAQAALYRDTWVSTALEAGPRCSTVHVSVSTREFSLLPRATGKDHVFSHISGQERDISTPARSKPTP